MSESIKKIYFQFSRDQLVEAVLLLSHFRNSIRFFCFILISLPLTLNLMAEVVLTDDFSQVKTADGFSVPHKPLSGDEVWNSSDLSVENGKVYPNSNLGVKGSGLMSLRLPEILDKIKKITISIDLSFGKGEIENPSSWISFGLGKDSTVVWHQKNLLSVVCFDETSPKRNYVQAHSVLEILKLDGNLKTIHGSDGPLKLALVVDLETNRFEITKNDGSTEGYLDPNVFEPGQFKRFATKGLFLNIQFLECRETAYVSNLSVSYE